MEWRLSPRERRLVTRIDGKPRFEEQVEDATVTPDLFEVQR